MTHTSQRHAGPGTWLLPPGMLVSAAEWGDCPQPILVPAVTQGEWPQLKLSLSSPCWNLMSVGYYQWFYGLCVANFLTKFPTQNGSTPLPQDLPCLIDWWARIQSAKKKDWTLLCSQLPALIQITWNCLLAAAMSMWYKYQSWAGKAVLGSIASMPIITAFISGEQWPQIKIAPATVRGFFSHLAICLSAYTGTHQLPYVCLVFNPIEQTEGPV